jgi:hypothetical protein
VKRDRHLADFHETCSCVSISCLHSVNAGTVYKLNMGNECGLICDLLCNYTASRGNYLPTFRENVSVPSSRVEIPRRKESP